MGNADNLISGVFVAFRIFEKDYKISSVSYVSLYTKEMGDIELVRYKVGTETAAFNGGVNVIR